ncbi:MAG: hypothetical protein A3G49_01505 [Candidatus Sungbacteria bacterium RIFCSPLOWO2_12_FULL_41_11]|uniref:Uncharacterized protein n=1 Tax=Candidatus Sungbacteria bacterium RIFCSPLOWO2_12_FULL_41_11 TaxID=1802286 RepID=A0A1G2LSQ6_9BACT|nr:MAG: hypothetical protein UV01_C0011G0020 [Parcubacteria group bacterium GW2011_GWA2_42_14]OHA13899.1 MAG: hypothetical protein A3G49_01505 [Candidatus Sungbacteria bacterium RIFCSPLOWO2_12_FULL_41_11]
MEIGKEKFEPEKRLYKIPEEIRKELESIREDKFWTVENLERQFEDDIAFGAKMWTGFDAILERKNLRKENGRI